ncbi:MAG: class I SAM-dependent methyltransferase [Candidatus Kerfeldbacteria bacterium]|nr:class I SAM-dependent methyltransferase [Candidatus Kerfeldbacteria bacterium]
MSDYHSTAALPVKSEHVKTTGIMSGFTCKICGQSSTLLYENLFDDRYGYPGKFSVYRCSTCGFGQTDPLLTPAALGKLYTDYYPRKNITVDEVRRSVTWRPGTLARWKRWLQGVNNTCHYHVTPNSKVLDIGCGNGASLLDIQAQGAEAVGTEEDRNVEPIAKALHLQIHFGDVSTSTYADQSFDFITMSQLLEHIPDPAAFLKRVSQKLKPTGQIIMSFPNIDGWNRRHSGRRWINWHIPYHINFFTPKSIRLLADQSGLKLMSLQTITPNVWVQLQSLANRHTAIEGQPSAFWSPDQGSEKSSMAKRLSSILALAMSYLCVPITRWRDWRHQGDSWLVVLSK